MGSSLSYDVLVLFWKFRGSKPRCLACSTLGPHKFRFTASFNFSPQNTHHSCDPTPQSNENIAVVTPTRRHTMFLLEKLSTLKHLSVIPPKIHVRIPSYCFSEAIGSNTWGTVPSASVMAWLAIWVLSAMGVWGARVATGAVTLERDIWIILRPRQGQIRLEGCKRKYCITTYQVLYITERREHK